MPGPVQTAILLAMLPNSDGHTFWHNTESLSVDTGISEASLLGALSGMVNPKQDKDRQWLERKNDEEGSWWKIKRAGIRAVKYDHCMGVSGSPFERKDRMHPTSRENLTEPWNDNYLRELIGALLYLKQTRALTARGRMHTEADWQANDAAERRLERITDLMTKPEKAK